ncbi:SPFH/Band 7/PHB domain protein [Candidatus Dependentiae bacterium]|nr:SPFH/Band 7/PHB domain protein [Candidatus Dependentiae bacterium]MBU4387176.1 SPFH/Band 7/PHB domain protein [Candidatus Dependentiae bacterium]MCG2755933.1 SPFH/Band 7/PHB domain protein [Candidatus Dependentiae bacterium]
MIFTFYTFFILFVLFLLLVISKSTYIVKQSEVIMVERLGKYNKMLKSGIHFVIPFIDQPRRVFWTFVKEAPSAPGKLYRYNELLERIDLREAVYDFPKQNVITRDNVTMEINALLYYQITDPERAIYEVSNLPQAIEKLTQTTLRNVIGALDLDGTLVSRDQINEKLREILDDATDKWGVKVNRVELQEVNPPQDIRVAMEKQMRAERDKRALILEAEGKKQAAILEAEGEKMSKITRAQGEAEARLLTTQAESEAIQMISKAVPGADPLPYMVALNYIKALPEITKDKEGKMILLPYESSALMGSLSTIKEIFKS